MRRAVPPFCAGLLLLGLWATAGCNRPPKPLPNILLISIDSLRSDHLGSYGYARDTSPNLDMLARSGARFETVVAPSPWTLPSHVTLLTGRHPAAHGVNDTDRKLAGDIPTLAEELHSAGYATAAFVSGPYLRRDYAYDRGFDLYDQALAAVSPGESRTGISSPQLVDNLLSWIVREKEATPGKPFFAFLHLWDVHYDFAPPPPWDTHFDPDYRGERDGTALEGLKPDLDARDLAHIIALYDGEIRFTDEELGRLFSALKARGLYEEMIIVVTADHGEEFFEHGRIGHAITLFEESLRVPLLVHYPRDVEGGQVVDGQVRLMDIAPTILGLAGVPQGDLGMPEGAPIESRDLSPWLRGDLLAGGFPELVAFPENRVWGKGRTAVRTTGDKLIRESGIDYFEVFDLRKDPTEASRRTGNGDDLAVTLWELLQLEKSFADWREAAEVRAPKLEVKGRLRAQLEALGYIDADPVEEPEAAP